MQAAGGSSDFRQWQETRRASRSANSGSSTETRRKVSPRHLQDSDNLVACSIGGLPVTIDHNGRKLLTAEELLKQQAKGNGVSGKHSTKGNFRVSDIQRDDSDDDTESKDASSSPVSGAPASTDISDKHNKGATETVKAEEPPKTRKSGKVSPKSEGPHPVTYNSRDSPIPEDMPPASFDDGAAPAAETKVPTATKPSSRRLPSRVTFAAAVSEAKNDPIEPNARASLKFTTDRAPTPRVSFSFGAERAHFSGAGITVNPDGDGSPGVVNDDVEYDIEFQTKQSLNQDRPNARFKPTRRETLEMQGSHFRPWKTGTLLNYFHVRTATVTCRSWIALLM